MGLVRPNSAPRALASLSVYHHLNECMQLLKEKKGGEKIIINIPAFPPFTELGVQFPFISAVKISICPLQERKELLLNFGISNFSLPLWPTK